MVMFLLAITLAILALVLFITAVFLRKEAASFESCKQPGKGVVVGYGSQYGDQLRVKLIQVEDSFFLNKNYDCKISCRLPEGEYPIGKIVDVWYAPRTLFGARYAVVYLVELPPVSGLKLGKAFNTIALGLVIIAAILAVIGRITML